MANLSANGRGILLMLAALASFVLNDSLLKMVIAEVTPYYGVAVRGAIAAVFSVGLLLALGQKLQFGQLVHKNVLWRNLADLASIGFYAFGIAYAALPAITSLSLLSPILIVVAARIFFNAEIRWLQWVLIFVSLVGALLVAQPGGSDFNIFAMTGFANAILVAARDLLGRAVPKHISGLTVVVSGNIIVTIGATIGTALINGWMPLTLTQVMLLAGAGVALTMGHFLIFSAFRIADAVVIAPYYYMAAIFAMIYSALLFGVVPNGIGFVGIALIVTAGVLLVLVSEGRRRMMVGRR